MKPTPELIAACKEVLRVFPEVDHLFISTTGRWLFCDDCFETPVFNGEIDISILEDMIDSLDNGDFEYPLTFYIPGILK